MEGGAGSPVVHEMLGALEDALSHEAEGLNHKTAANVLWPWGSSEGRLRWGGLARRTRLTHELERRLVSNS